MRFRRIRRWSAVGWVGLLGLGLAGCNVEGLSDGNKPESLEIQTEDATAAVLYRCTTPVISAAVTYSNGLADDYTQRVTWSSSDPGVVEVSNGDIEIGSTGTYYSAGVLVPHTDGNATITAEFVGLSDSADVEVKSPKELWIEGDFNTIATGTSTQLEFYGVLDQDIGEVSLSGSAEWSIPAADGSLDVASSSGVVSALAPGEAQAIRAGFATCDEGAEFTIQAQDATGLAAEYEFDEDVELAVGTTERITVYASFEDPDTPWQNISSEVDYELNEDSDDYVATVSASDEALYLLAADEGEAALDLRFDAADLELTTRFRTFVERDFDSVVITPEQSAIGWSDELQLEAVATDSETGVSQSVTRHISWSLDVSDVLTVSSSDDEAGLVTPLGDQDGEVEIIGTLSGTVDTVDAVVNVLVYNDDE